MQIIILGMHRSGTSAVARIINMMGAYFAPADKQMPPQPDNPKGFWERLDVVAINDQILSGNNATWDTIANFDPTEVNSKTLNALNLTTKALIDELDEHQPWMIKDPRLSITLPIWEENLSAPVIIYVHRNPMQIAQSLQKRNGLPLTTGLALWEAYAVAALNASAAHPRVCIDYNQLMKDPVAQTDKLYQILLGLGGSELKVPTEQQLLNFIDPTLFHNRDTTDELPSYANKQQMVLAKILIKGKLPNPAKTLSLSKSSLSILSGYSDFKSSFKALQSENTKIQQEHKDTMEEHKAIMEEHWLKEQNTTQETERLTSSLALITTQKNQLSNELATTQSAYSQIQESLVSTQEQLGAANEEIETQQQSHEQGLRKVTEKLSELTHLYDSEMSLKTEAIKQLSYTKYALKKAGNDRSELLKQLGKATDRLHTTNDKLIKENKLKSSLQSNCDTLTAKNVSLKQELKLQNKEKTQLENDVAKDRDKIQPLQDNLASLSHEREQLVDLAKLNQQTLKHKNEALESQLKEHTQQLKLLKNWLADIDRDTQSIFRSLRWKAGSTLARIIEIILLRFKPALASDHLRSTLQEYNSWRKNNISDQETSYQPQKPTSKTKAFFGFLAVALCHPIKTWRLLSLEKLKNFYVTLSKQPDHTREQILDYYLKQYGENSTTTREIHATQTPKVDETIHLPLIDTPTVSIIIPVYNQFEFTLSCLKSIADHPQKTSFEVIIADDCSTDETVDIEKCVTNLKRIITPENFGFLKNCNLAATTAKGKYLLILNNDTHVTDGWLDQLVNVMEQDSLVGMTGSKFIYPDGSLQEAGGIIWNDASGWNYGRNDDPDKPEYNYQREVDYVSGAGFLVRKKLWDELDGFDEYFAPAYYEDTDLAFQIRAKGYKVVYQPKSVIVHFEGKSHGTDETQGIKAHQVINKERFYEKWKTTLEAEHFPNAENVFLARDRSRNKKTLLLIDHYVPHYDKDAGSRSTFMYLKWFVECGMNVKFIGDNFYQHEPYTRELQNLGIEVLYGNWYANHWRDWIKENGKHLDYIYLHRPHIAPKYLDTVRKYSQAKLIYFGHDLHYLRTQRQYDIEKNAALLPAIEDWRKKEFAIFNKVDVVYYPSDIEIAEIKKQAPELTARAIPLYIFDPLEKLENTFKKRNDLFFIGGFRHEPNIDALMWFTKEIFPLIVAKLPDLRLIVAGSNMPKNIKALQSSQVIIKGEISTQELEQCYRDCRVVIVPLRYGAGIKGKVLEALQYQVPVVTTDIGAEGLPGRKDYLNIANEASEFAEKVVTLYTNESRWLELTEKGRQMINHHFSRKNTRRVLQQDINFNK